MQQNNDSSYLAQGIHVTAYSPMGTPPSSSMFKDFQPKLAMDDPVVKELAEKYKKNVGQVIICLLQTVILRIRCSNVGTNSDPPDIGELNGACKVGLNGACGVGLNGACGAGLYYNALAHCFKHPQKNCQSAF